MKRITRSVLSSQEGKLDIVIMTGLMVGIVGWVVSKYTGSKVLVFTLSSGIKRMSIGLFGLLFVYGVGFLEMQFRDTLALGDYGELILATTFVTCWLLVFILIPLGLIQVVGSVVKKKLNKQ
jgi:hypothetical protein